MKKTLLALMVAAGTALAAAHAPTQVAAAAEPSVAEALSPRKLTPHQHELLRGLAPADRLATRLAALRSALKALEALQARSPRDAKAMHKKAAEARRALADLLRLARQLETGFAKAEQHVATRGGKTAAEALRKRLEGLAKDLEAQDRLGNFSIQDLMSSFTQAETLASTIKKRADLIHEVVIRKIS